MPLPCFLLVDDLDENLISLEALLSRDGLTILKAKSGDEALELLLQNEVALALIDVQMPGLNGFELAELMRGNERTRRVPIIFVTAGSPDRQRYFRGYEAGAVDFIQKPIEADILRSKADVFFELSRQSQQISEQRDELAAQAEALKEADRRKDEFLATLAHELRNPLAPLRQGLDVLRRNPNSAVAANILDVMDRQLLHLVRLIDDLLDVSRVSQGKIELQKERLDAATVVKTAIEASQPLISAGGHSLDLSIPSQTVWLDGDLTRLSQVVSNLLNNAAKYTPNGGRIDVSLGADQHFAEITVSDNGVGIPPGMHEKVFHLFTQVDNHMARAQGGLGIGLALVKKLVELHGGKVTAENRPTGTGSVFKVQLPLLKSGDNDGRDSDATPTQFGSSCGLKVLVVDDNIDVALAMSWMLEDIGHDVYVVHDGRQALEAALEYRPDVVLLDIGLPGMDGYQVCRALRENDQFKKTPIIAQTGWGQTQHKSMAADAGFSDHLTKPVALEKLEETLAKFCL